MKKKLKNYETFYVGTRGRSVGQIKKEFVLYNALRDFVDDQNFTGLSSKTIFRQIKAFVKQRDDLQWALKKESGYGWLWYVRRTVSFVGQLLYIIVKGILLALPTLLWLRKLEKSDGVNHDRISLARREALEKAEDIHLQNQMTHIVDIKPGWYRFQLSRLSLRIINFLASYCYNKGKLGGIPSIHFARWMVLDRQFVFFSNFDGSWINYLGDFIDKASTGLTAAWSCTIGFPRTRWLIKDGASIAQQFKRWARNLQQPTQVWYAAYPNYSVENINDHSKIRQVLAGALHGKKLDQWLALL